VICGGGRALLAVLVPGHQGPYEQHQSVHAYVLRAEGSTLCRDWQRRFLLGEQFSRACFDRAAGILPRCTATASGFCWSRKASHSAGCRRVAVVLCHGLCPVMQRDEQSRDVRRTARTWLNSSLQAGSCRCLAEHRGCTALSSNHRVYTGSFDPMQFIALSGLKVEYDHLSRTPSRPTQPAANGPTPRTEAFLSCAPPLSYSPPS